MVRDVPFERFLKLSERFGFPINETAEEKFKLYHSLLLEWGKKINLYSQNDRNRLLSYHFLDSLLALKFLPETGDLADIGSGAGFPGIPIKIMRPNLNLFLFETRKKKAVFLSYVIKSLSLPESTVIDKRVEDWEGKRFDIFTIRLLGKIKKVIPLIAHLRKEKSLVIFYKGREWEREIEEAEGVLKKFNLTFTGLHTFHLSHLKLTRKILLFQ